MKKEGFKIKKKIFWTGFLFFSLLIFIFFARTVDAATLYFSPNTGSYKTGTEFTVSIYVSSADQAMNAASGVVNFPTDKLEVASISKVGSIFTLWVQEPSFSNDLGTVNFEGIVLNPGFTGQSGRIISINFRIKSTGTASLNLSPDSVLANDGNGTEILTGTGGAEFSLVEAEAAPTPPVTVAPSGTPAAPEIHSSTHPDQNAWYDLNYAKFDWSVSSDITASRVSMDDKPIKVPATVYSPANESSEFSGVADGVWYIHVQLKNDAGWGAVSNFRFQIDTQPPEHFQIIEVKRDDPTDPKAKFLFDATDKTSGIDHYEIQIDNGEVINWTDDGNHTYEVPASDPGNHKLTAKAVDKAGNYLESSIDFSIQPLEAPIITSYPRTLQTGQPLIVKGTSKYTGGEVTVWLQKGNDLINGKTEVDKDGKFTFLYEKSLKEGNYNLWAEVVDSRGAKSDPSQKVTISIQPSSFFKFGSSLITFLLVIIPLIALILILVIIIWYGFYRLSRLRKRIRKGALESEMACPEILHSVKEDIQEQIKLLEKTKAVRQLTREEEKILKQLKKSLEEAGSL